MQLVSISEEKRKYNVREDVLHLTERLEKEREEVTGVDISENSFSSECILEIVQVLGAMPNVKIVNFKGIFTGRQKEDVEESLRHICKHLAPLRGITYLDMSDNALSVHGMEILTPLIPKLESLEHLVLNNNGMGVDGGAFLAEALGELSQKSRKLESIEVGRNRLEKSISAIGESLAKFPFMDTIRVYQNGISCTSMCEFLKEIAALRVRVLDLNDNFLLTHGAHVLGTCMNAWDIEVLNASDCLIGDMGMAEMCKALQHKTELQGSLSQAMEIDLSYNEISDEAVSEVEGVLSKLCTSKIILTGNEFGSSSIALLNAAAWEKGGSVLYEEEDEEFLLGEEEPSREEILNEQEAQEAQEAQALGEKLVDLKIVQTASGETKETEDAAVESGI